MKHTFQLSFVSHTGVKRKYCFSVPDAQTRSRWAQAIHRQIVQTRTLRAKQDPNELRRVAEAVSLQVLRDALLPNPKSSAQNGQSSNYKSAETENGRADGAGNGRMRQGSVSATYRHLVTNEESELGPLQPPRTAVGTEGPQSGLVEVQTGKELVLLCRQNSLLPGLLELLTAGREDMTHTSLTGSTTSTAKSVKQSEGNGYGNGTMNANMSRNGSRKGQLAGRF